MAAFNICSDFGCGGGLATKSCPTLGIPWTIACQAPLSVGFSRQEYWCGLPCLLPGDLPDPGIKPACLLPPEFAGGFFTTSVTWEAHYCCRAVQPLPLHNPAAFVLSQDAVPKSTPQ